MKYVLLRVFGSNTKQLQLMLLYPKVMYSDNWKWIMFSLYDEMKPRPFSANAKWWMVFSQMLDMP